MDDYTFQAWCSVCRKVTLHRNGKCSEKHIWTKSSNSTSECPTCNKVVNQCKCEREITITAKQYANWVPAVELLQDVANSGVEYVAVGYVTVQIDEGTWKEIQDWLRAERGVRE